MLSRECSLLLQPTLLPQITKGNLASPITLGFVWFPYVLLWEGAEAKESVCADMVLCCISV